MTEIRSVLFDFDGLLANTEPLHFETFLKVLAENDVLLPPGTEQADFTGIHDRASFRKAFRKVGRSIEPDQVEELVDRKSSLYLEEAATIALF